MDASDKMGVAVSGNGEISTHIFSSEVVNQYGQLVGEFSKLDDELWLSAPDDVEPMAFSNDGFQLDHVSSHLHEHIADLHCADNSITNGGMASAVNNSSFLNDSSQSQSRTLSPVSVLPRRSYSKETTFVIRRARSKQCPRSRSSGTEASQLCQSENYVERFVLDETDSYPGRMLRTRKVSDLLQLHSTEENYSNAGTALHQRSPTEEVKRCVHCETAQTPQWRDGPIGRKTLCNACGIQYKKALLSADYHPLSIQKRRKKGSKKCVHCDATKTLQWRNGPRGPKSLCNGCGIWYKKYLRAIKFHSSRAPRSDASLPTKLPKMLQENFEKIAEKNPPSNQYQMKVQKTRVAENGDIDRDCGRKGTTIQDITEKTDDMRDSGSNHRNGKPIFIPIPRKELPKAMVKKCDHCESTNTPQWREGPNGRNTLCNACGVQFKKGRLFPEYRPLKSPTYDPSLHSHLPKTVEKMRMCKISAERAKSGNNEHAA